MHESIELASADGDARNPGPGRTAIEVILVFVLGCGWFFWGSDVGDFTGMEALRAVVVKEMLARDDAITPTVHDRVYLRKLPLYAWTTRVLASRLGRFDEQVARWPSCALGVVYLLTIYCAARWLIDGRAGPTAVVIAAGNLMLLNYGMRADLDMGVLALTTLAVVLLGRAWVARGALRWGALLACYLSALAGSYWKAPHVLVTVWLTILGLIWMERRARPAGREAIRFALHPIHLCLAALAVAAVAAWYVALTDAAGSGSRVGKFVLLEALARVVPHSLGYVAELPLGIPLLLAAAFPASVFALLVLMPEVRRSLGIDGNPKHMWLMAWLVPNALFLLFVHAKAARYWFLIVGGITLLGAWAWWQIDRGYVGERPRQVGTFVVRGLFGLALVAGVALAGLAVLLVADVLEPEGVAVGPPVAAMIASAVLMLLAAGAGVRSGAGSPGLRLGLAACVVLLAVKITQVYAYLPLRSSMGSLRPTAKEVDRLVPPGAPLFVLSDKPGSDRAGELGDLGYYCERSIVWPRTLDDLLVEAGGQPFYLLARVKVRERTEERFGDRTHHVAELAWTDHNIHLLHVRPEPPSSTSRGKPPQ